MSVPLKTTSDENADQGFIPQRGSIRTALLVLMFLLAFAVRLYQIDAPPTDFHPMRQYRAAIIAREMYVQNLDTLPDWEKEIARINAADQGALEPQIMESLAAIGYALAGSEQLWIVRVFSAMCWVVGGIFLFKLAELLLTADAAFGATAFYLFAPFGVRASRVYLPEPLLTMLLLLSLLLIVRYYHDQSWRRLIAAAVVASVMLYVKPVAVFVTFSVFAALTLDSRRKTGKLDIPHVLTFVAIAVLPVGIYYAYGLFSNDFLRSQVQVQFVPSFYWTLTYWGGWFQMIGRAVGYTALVVALLGLILLPTRLSKLFILAAWGGYVLLGLVFNLDMATHDYYHLPLIPIVGLSIGPVVALVFRRLGEHHPYAWWRASIVAALIILVGILRVQELRFGLGKYEYVDDSIVTVAPEIGDKVDHSAATIMLSGAYGEPLRYYGKLAGSVWPPYSSLLVESLLGNPPINTEEHLDSLLASEHPRYFIITDFGEFALQPDLQAILTERYELIEENSAYLIFDLQSTRAPED